MQGSAITAAGWMDKRNQSYSVRANFLVTAAAFFIETAAALWNEAINMAKHLVVCRDAEF
jgi:hypothetical protein